MPGDTLRLGLAQMTSIDSVASNLSAVKARYREAARAGAELIVFPENTLYFRIRDGDRPREPAPQQLDDLRRAVDEVGVPMMLTTAFGERERRFGNATLLLRPGQKIENVYEKIHLFDIALAGRAPIRESKDFRPGAHGRIVDLLGWRIGLTICYDLRFPELFLTYASRADLILVPAAFLVETGRAHWHVLLRARAIESQAWIAAPAQAGLHRSGDVARSTYGHSLVVNPWGEVEVDCGLADGVRVVELRRGDVNKMREQIPMADHRRPC